MRRLLFSPAAVLFATSVMYASQSSEPAKQSGSDAVKPAAPRPAEADAGENGKKKPRKVWTNEEILNVGGEGSISVVGKMPDTNAKGSSKNASAGTARASAAKEQQIAGYRNRLRQLHNQLENTEKQIFDLRNFKAENTGASGGINMNRGYSMTPVEDQVKNLEEKKKQIQAQIDGVEDAARKNRVEPGELR